MDTYESVMKTLLDSGIGPTGEAYVRCGALYVNLMYYFDVNDADEANQAICDYFEAQARFGH